MLENNSLRLASYEAETILVPPASPADHAHIKEQLWQLFEKQ